MEPPRFWIHLIIGLTLSMALSVANLVSGGEAASGRGEGRGGLPPDRESSSPLRAASTAPQHRPSTGQTDETKPKKNTPNDEKTSDSITPRKHPSSHAEKHPDYDRTDPEKKKPLDKESH